MTARRFLGSRTSGPVGTSGSWKLLPSMAMASPTQTLADHFVLHGGGAADRQRLVVAVRTDGVGVAGDHDADGAQRLGSGNSLGDRRLRFRGEVRLIEVEEDDVRLRRREAAAAGEAAAEAAAAGEAAAAAAGAAAAASGTSAGRTCPHSPKPSSHGSANSPAGRWDNCCSRLVLAIAIFAEQLDIGRQRIGAADDTLPGSRSGRP